MFPISDTKHDRGGIPIFNLTLVAITIFVFYTQFTSRDTNALINAYSLIPKNINFLDIESLLPFVTSIFLHGGIFHIASNMWFLWIFGDNIEKELGPIKFLMLYLISGIAGSFLQYILNPTSPIPMIGASGAVSGIMAAYLVMFPKHTIKSFVFIVFLITIVNIPAIFYIGYWFLLQLLNGVVNLPGKFQSDQGGVAFFAHVGGFIMGLILAKIFQSKNKDFIEGKLVD